jgi:hypothetical protein
VPTILSEPRKRGLAEIVERGETMLARWTFRYVIKCVGVDSDEGAKKHPQLRCTEHGRGFVENPVELGYTRLVQLLSAGAFGFRLRLFPLELLSTLIGFPLLLLLVLLSLLFVVALAFLGLFLCLGFGRRRHCRGGIGGLFFCCSWLVYTAIVVRAYGESGYVGGDYFFRRLRFGGRGKGSNVAGFVRGGVAAHWVVPPDLNGRAVSANKHALALAHASEGGKCNGVGKGTAGQPKAGGSEYLELHGAFSITLRAPGAELLSKVWLLAGPGAQEIAFAVVLLLAQGRSGDAAHPR